MRLCCGSGGYADAAVAMLRRRGGYAAAMWRLCGVAVAAMRRRLSAMLRPVRRRLCGVCGMSEAAASIDAAAGGALLLE